MMSALAFFPLSVATGKAFCNRVVETERLKLCIEHHRPILLISPRRYGKTSLALHAIQQTNYPYGHIDFFSAVDEKDIETAILKGVGKLLSRMESLPKRALSLASEIFEGSQIRTVLSKVGLSIEINQRNECPAYHILDLLERLEKLAEKTQQKLILFFDEFQSVGELSSDHTMESVLRQMAQLTKGISFIFSGSNRHLLNQLFDDRNRPFYKLCEKISLERISEEHYAAHIQKAAQKTWGASLTTRSLDTLFLCTERHPYYLNLLCSRFISEKKLPTEQSILDLWEHYIMEERSGISSELALLTPQQRKLLTLLSRLNGTEMPLGREFVQKTNMSKTTIAQALAFLEKQDYVEKSNGIFKTLDPAIKSALCSEHAFA